MFIEPEEDDVVFVSGIMLFDSNERLMCPHCGITSNNHFCSAPFFYQYTHSPFIGPQLVCHHTCHRCGYKDDIGSGFIDSGNYECDETSGLNEWEEELSELEDEIAELKEKITRGKRRWDMLWNVKTDET